MWTIGAARGRFVRVARTGSTTIATATATAPRFRPIYSMPITIAGITRKKPRKERQGYQREGEGDEG